MRMLLDTFSQTLQTLWAHKLRSFLTMFGIAWGGGSLLLLAGVGEGFRNGNRKQLESFGKNIIFFFGGRAPRFRTKRWNEIPENPPPEGRTNLAQRFKSRRDD
jgi:hypothetical protein